MSETEVRTMLKLIEQVAYIEARLRRAEDEIRKLQPRAEAKP
jgi:hypothetical protein